MQSSLRKSDINVRWRAHKVRKLADQVKGFQRELGSAVKRARYLALLPYVRRQDG